MSMYISLFSIQFSECDILSSLIRAQSFHWSSTYSLQIFLVLKKEYLQVCANLDCLQLSNLWYPYNHYERLSRSTPWWKTRRPGDIWVYNMIFVFSCKHRNAGRLGLLYVHTSAEPYHVYLGTAIRPALRPLDTVNTITFPACTNLLFHSSISLLTFRLWSEGKRLNFLATLYCRLQFKGLMDALPWLVESFFRYYACWWTWIFCLKTL